MKLEVHDVPRKADFASRWTLQQENWPQPSKENWSLHSGEVRVTWPWGHRLTSSGITQAHSRTLGWPTLTSTTSRTCWSSWRDWSYGMIPSESPRHEAEKGYPRGILVRIQWLWSTRNQRPWPRLVTHWSEQLLGKLTGQKGMLCAMWHTKAPNVTRMNEQVLEKQERRRVFLLLFCFVSVSCFLL